MAHFIALKKKSALALFFFIEPTVTDGNCLASNDLQHHYYLQRKPK